MEMLFSVSVSIAVQPQDPIQEREKYLLSYNIWGIDRLHRTDKLKKVSLACDGPRN